MSLWCNAQETADGCSLKSIRYYDLVTEAWGYIRRLEKWTRNLECLLFSSFFFMPQEPIRKQ